MTTIRIITIVILSSLKTCMYSANKITVVSESTVNMFSVYLN